MRELERQQKEQEQNADRVFDMQTAAGIDPLSRSRHTLSANSARGSSSLSSRRSSEDSLEEEGRSLRDIRHELKVFTLKSHIFSTFLPLHTLVFLEEIQKHQKITDKDNTSELIKTVLKSTLIFFIHTGCRGTVS